MGWSYRKAVSLGPFRVNLSKSGFGYSVGARGFRTGVRPNGRTYSRISLPGTGLSHHSSHTPSKAGCVVVLASLSASTAILASCV